jgi:hypothetical protein
MSDAKKQPRFNHVGLSLPADALDDAGRKEIVDFFNDVFGWHEIDLLTLDRKRLVLQCYTVDQFVFIHADDEPLKGPRLDHFGIRVFTMDELDGMVARAKAWAERDERVDIIDKKADDQSVVVITSFYVRFILPLMVEIQHWEWKDGVPAR